MTKAPDGNYYIAAGGIFQGTLTSGVMSWNPNNNNLTVYPYNPPSGALCNALATFNGATWGGFYPADGLTILGLEKADPQFSFASSTPVVDTNGNITGKQISLLSAPNGNAVLFAVCVELNYSVGLYYSTNGTAWSPCTGLQGITSYPISGVAWDGTQYWAVSGTTVYRSPAGNPASFSAIATQPVGSSDIRGITVGQGAEAGWLFLPTRIGGIWYSSNGGASWANIAAPIVSSVTVGLLTVSGPVDSAGNIYLVGSDGYGYYTLNLTLPALTRMSMSTIALYAESIRKIFVDAGFVLMGTNGHGVWSASFDPATGDLTSGTSWTGPTS